MLDELLTLAVQHYVVFGFLGIAFGVLLNLALTAGPEMFHLLRSHKLY